MGFRAPSIVCGLLLLVALPRGRARRLPRGATPVAIAFAWLLALSPAPRLLQPDRPLLPADDLLRSRRGGRLRRLVADLAAGLRRRLRRPGRARGLAPPGGGADRRRAVPLRRRRSRLGEAGGARPAALRTSPSSPAGRPRPSPPSCCRPGSRSPGWWPKSARRRAIPWETIADVLGLQAGTAHAPGRPLLAGGPGRASPALLARDRRLGLYTLTLAGVQLLGHPPPLAPGARQPPDPRPLPPAGPPPGPPLGGLRAGAPLASAGVASPPSCPPPIPTHSPAQGGGTLRWRVS